MSDQSSSPVENIASLGDFEAWMRELSPYLKLHIPPIIAVRCALRVMPFASDAFYDRLTAEDSPNGGETIALAIFRTLLTARIAWLQPSSALARACRNAGDDATWVASGRISHASQFDAWRAASAASICVAGFVDSFESNTVVVDLPHYARRICKRRATVNGTHPERPDRSLARHRRRPAANGNRRRVCCFHAVADLAGRRPRLVVSSLRFVSSNACWHSETVKWARPTGHCGRIGCKTPCPARPRGGYL